MSKRQQLKKLIYKGKNVPKNKELLNKMGYTTEQILQQKKSRLNQIYDFLERKNYSAIYLDRVTNEINDLIKEIRDLTEKTKGEEAWFLDYHIKYKLNSIEYNLGYKMEKELKKFNPKKVSLVFFSKDHRYIIFNIDGKEKRINYLTKKEYVNKNYFWVKYKNCAPTYKNCVRLKNK
jgi:hypothetical protein